jgi:hypothetical protein
LLDAMRLGDRALAELLMQAHLRSLAAELRFAPARVQAPDLQAFWNNILGGVDAVGVRVVLHNMVVCVRPMCDQIKEELINLLIHSDRGSQFASEHYQSVLSKHDIK